MGSSSVRSRSLLLGWPSTLLLGIVLLGGCTDTPPETSASGSSSGTGDPTGPGPVSLTATGPTSTGVVDDTGTSGGVGTTSTSSSGGDTGTPQDCCSPHREAGCDDPALVECVCNEEAFCCAFAWDASCVDLAEQCGGCGAGTGTTGETGGPEPSACCMPQAGPGCAEDPMLETCVCDLDTYCCDTQWDDQCVQEAVRQCSAACGMGGGDCCVPSGSPGCAADPVVETCVCGLDAFCCDTQWDNMCVMSAQNDCGLMCMNGGGGDCCTASGGLGCDDMAVSDCVCAVDPFCCDTQWDDICASEAQYVCMDDCGLPPANMGDCCMAQPGPGCGDMAVADCTCMIDDGCCLFPWDDHCIVLAVTACGIECAGVVPLDPCCLVQAGAGCGDMTLEDCVCAFDDYCCTTQWDGQCVDEAQMACALDCSGGGGTGGTGGTAGTAGTAGTM